MVLRFRAGRELGTHGVKRMQIHHFLEKSADIFPDKPAVWYQDSWTTNAQIDSSSNKVANYLIDAGVKRGDRVAILYENSVDYIVAYFGILKTGGITVALNTESTSDSVLFALNDSGAIAIIANKKYSRQLYTATCRGELTDR